MGGPYVYFIRPVGMIGPIKIGCSHNPEQRRRQLRLCSPVDLEVVGAIEGGLGDEYAVQAYLADHQSHGEWFLANSQVLAVIDQLLSGRIAVNDLGRDGKSPCKARGKWSAARRRAHEQSRVDPKPAKRLKEARIAAGYQTAKAAAEAIGASIATYIQHENATRGFQFRTAEVYGRAFGVVPGQIVFGDR